MDLDNLIPEILKSRTPGERSIHGPTHWARVERNAVYCAEQSGGDVKVAILFALLHDCRRLNDGSDPQHGKRGGVLAKELNGGHFQLSEDRLNTLVYACEHHTFGKVTDDPTIGSCWDGDRLDLTRIGATPNPNYMSTEAGKELARSGSIDILSERPLRRFEGGGNTSPKKRDYK